MMTISRFINAVTTRVEVNRNGFSEKFIIITNENAQSHALDVSNHASFVKRILTQVQVLP